MQYAFIFELIFISLNGEVALEQGMIPTDSWKSYMASANSYCGIVKNTATKNNVKVMDSENTYKSINDCKLVIIHNNITDEQELYASNKDYSFSLVRKNPRSGWRVTSIIRKTSPLDSNLSRNMLESEIVKCGALQIYNNSILDLLSNDSAKLVNHDNSKNSYTYNISIQGNNIVKIFFILDNADPFLVKEYIANIRTPAVNGTISSTIEYWNRLPADMPKTIRENHDLMISGQNVKISLIKEYTNPGSMSAKLEEFYLKYYGVTEPTWLDADQLSIFSKMPWFFYLTIAGVICLLVSSFILYRRNKQAAA